MGAAEVQAFLSWLAVERHVSVSTHRQALAALDVEMLAEALQGREVLGMNWIQARLPEIHLRYVKTIDPPPRMRSRWARLPAATRS